MLYTLCCIVIGQNTPFLVELDETQSVGELKKEIIEKKPSLNVDASRFVSYKANIDMSDVEKCIQEVRDISEGLTNAKNQPFNSRHKLSKYFEEEEESCGFPKMSQ